MGLTEICCRTVCSVVVSYFQWIEVELPGSPKVHKKVMVMCPARLPRQLLVSVRPSYWRNSSLVWRHFCLYKNEKILSTGSQCCGSATTRNLPRGLDNDNRYLLCLNDKFLNCLKKYIFTRNFEIVTRPT
jgi:hypothetical protein